MKRKEVMRGVYDLGVTLGAGEVRPCCVAAAQQPPSSPMGLRPTAPYWMQLKPPASGRLLAHPTSR